MEYYRTLENDLEESFRRFGSKLTAMDAIDRLKSLHDFYRMGKEEEFQLTWDEIKKGKKYLLQHPLVYWQQILRKPLSVLGLHPL